MQRSTSARDRPHDPGVWFAVMVSLRCSEIAMQSVDQAVAYKAIIALCGQIPRLVDTIRSGPIAAAASSSSFVNVLTAEMYLVGHAAQVLQKDFNGNVYRNSAV